MSYPNVQDVYSAPYQGLVTQIGGAQLIAGRTTWAQIGRSGTVSAQRGETFGFAYQLAPLGGDEFWNDEGHTRLPAVPRGGIHINDLRAGGTVRFADTAFDSFNVSIPMAALRELAERNDAFAPTDLRVPDAWVTLDPFVASLERALLHVADGGHGVEPLASEHLIIALVSHIAIRFGGMRPATGTLVGALSPNKLRLAQATMLDELSQPVSLADLARLCELSPSHFSRAFKRATGQSPSDWLIKQRVARAKDILRRGELTLAEVAYGCGFADQSHFTRTFSKHVGHAPGAWRRTRR